jgi:hypothetical protein
LTVSAAAIAAWVLAHPGWIDRDVTREQREPYVQRYAQAIADEARTPTEAAMALAQGFEDSKFAFLVMAGRCDEMPRGQQCDHGTSRGAFQLKEATCPTAYRFAPGTEESIRAETHCVLAQLRFHAWRCREHALTPLFGAFSGIADGHSCHWGGAGARVLRTRRIAAELARARFVSMEPLLEDTGFDPMDAKYRDDEGRIIDLVIVGGESGHGRRPMRSPWVRAVRDRCLLADVQFFFKQRIGEDGTKISLPLLDGRQWGEPPEART